MAQQAVSIVIHALLTDQHLRDRFAESPMEVLVDFISRPTSSSRGTK